MGLLDDLGVPYIVAPMEAEAQCGLGAGGFGGRHDHGRQRRFLFWREKGLQEHFDDKKFVEAYFAEDCRRELKLGRCEFVSLALLLGGDYAHGVKGVGIVNAMEVLQAFHFPHAHSENQVDASIASLKQVWAVAGRRGQHATPRCACGGPSRDIGPRGRDGRRRRRFRTARPRRLMSSLESRMRKN